MMNKHNPCKRQSGFFDLGISLAILAISSGVALTINHEQDEKIVAQQTKAMQQERVAIDATPQPSSVEAVAGLNRKQLQ